MIHTEATENIEKTKCQHLDCKEISEFEGLCRFHLDGGVLGIGETYEHYQVIEEDFINFLKIIPLSDERNMKVCSPVLRDLIIRSCVQIEIFFKEWAKYECATNNDIELSNLYNSPNNKGIRNWNFKHYYYFQQKYFLKESGAHVRELNKNIFPFSFWEEKTPPRWWNVYNSIKHGGLESKIESNLEITLECISALFILHCSNIYSRNYLSQFISISAFQKTFGKTKITFDRIKTPLDSKKYLFQDITRSARSTEFLDIKDQETISRASRIGRTV